MSIFEMAYDRFEHPCRASPSPPRTSAEVAEPPAEDMAQALRDDGGAEGAGAEPVADANNRERILLDPQALDRPPARQPAHDRGHGLSTAPVAEG